MYRLSSLLSHDNFIPVSKILASKIGLLEATLFGELCAESDYWHKENKITEDGYFFSTVENIEEKLFIKKDVQQRIIKKLTEEGLISVSKRGLPAKRYIKINEEILAKQLTENALPSRRNFRQLDDGISSTNKTISNKTIYNTNSHNISFTYNIDLSKYDVDNESEFREVIQEWLDYKKEKKQSYKSQSSLNIFIKRLVGLTGGRSAIARERVESSIANNYQGCLFQENKNSSQIRASVSYVENANDWSEGKEIFEEYYRQKEEERRRGKE